jgi:hypothetical protein
MAETARTGFVWNTFMKNAEARAAIEVAGFRAASGAPAASPHDSLQFDDSQSLGWESDDQFSIL